MNEMQLYAVHGSDLVALPVVDGARDLHELFPAQREPEAIYSALRTFHGDRFLRLDAHFSRCQRCIEHAGWSNRFDLEGLRHAIANAVSRRSGDSRLRFDLLRAPITLADVRADVLLGLAPHTAVPASILQQGAHLGLAPTGLSRPEPRIKYTAWVTDRGVCRQPGADYFEHLLLDEQERILEGTSSNFYGLKGDTLVTAATGVLEGITCQVVLELAAARGLRIERRSLSLPELYECDEAWLTSSTRGVVPVTQVDGRQIDTGNPGPTTRHLMADYDNYADQHAVAAIAW